MTYLLEKIFPNYKQKSNWKPIYCEGTFVVSKRLIHCHKIDTYKMILLEYLEKCKNQIEEKNMIGIHDEFTEFYHFFFTETLLRSNFV